jgi:hypothetical protein
MSGPGSSVLLPLLAEQRPREVLLVGGVRHEIVSQMRGVASSAFGRAARLGRARSPTLSLDVITAGELLVDQGDLLLCAGQFQRHHNEHPTKFPRFRPKASSALALHRYRRALPSQSDDSGRLPLLANPRLTM